MSRSTSSFGFLELLAAHPAGEVRCGVASVATDDLSGVLAKFGLTPNAEALIELDRPRAVGSLKRLIGRGLAYELPCMPPEEAGRLAEALIAAHEYPGSRYYSNGDWLQGGSWTPLTAATFDGGLLMSCEGGCYFCIWFEDED